MNNNNTNTIALTNPTHGLFKVQVPHLDDTYSNHSGWSLEALLHKVHYLTGDLSDYTDLTYPEAMILVSYLTGGSAD